MRKPPEPLRCLERVHLSSGKDDIHPGWIRATAILLRGMERLKAQSDRERY